MSHLPVLIVILPLLAAPLCVLIRHALAVRFFATAVCLATFAIACGLYQELPAEGSLSYAIGGWEPPWGIELQVDSLTVLISLIVSGIAALVISTGIGDKSHQLSKDKEAFFYAAYLLCLTGLLGMTLTGDAFNVFVFLEISSLSTYTLIALGKSRRSINAALSYLMVGTVGGTFILLGIGLLYQLTGTLNMADLALQLPAQSHSRTLPVAFSFLFVGLGLKVAVFPLHQWLPNAYAFAPSAVSAFVAGTATKVIYYLMIRFCFTVFGAVLVFETLKFGDILMPLSLAAMFFGSIAAIYQDDLKRLLAFSSVAQLGYLTLALSLGTESGLQAGLIHVFNHALMKSGLFLVAAAVVAALGTSQVQSLAGLGKRMPLTMAAMVLGGLGLIGVPGTSGFISKWYLVTAALESGKLALAFLILTSSLLAVIYVWKLVEIAYFKKPTDTLPSSAVDRPSILIPTWTLMGATLFFGVFTEFPRELSEKAAAQLMVPHPTGLAPPIKETGYALAHDQADPTSDAHKKRKIHPGSHLKSKGARP